MSQKSWQQVREVFHDALRHDSAERGRFLDKACDGDIDFRIEVESLLISLTDAKAFLERPAVVETWKKPREAFQLKAGDTVSHYRIETPIGVGGMGEVYLAEDQKLHRSVALKVLQQDLLQNRDRMRRFQREAEVVSALNHPNILTVFEFDVDGDVHLIVCEYVKGETLRARLERGPLPVEEALDIAIQIASALNAAHEAGVVHRDIKPDNVMIRDDGYVKVLDFGLAKLTEPVSTDGPADPRVQIFSQPGLIMGTAAYMSPEQTRGSSIDFRSDIFSFGVVIYEMLSGSSPFKGETNTDVIAAIIQREPRPVSHSIADVPQEVDAIIARSLEKNKVDRYQTSGEMLAALKSVRKDMEFLDSMSNLTLNVAAPVLDVNEIAADPDPVGTTVSDPQPAQPVRSTTARPDGRSNLKLIVLIAIATAVFSVITFGYC
ncbi:MAG: serine/threonine-protein kinase [Pyrinomonadaceae bacterium]